MKKRFDHIEKAEVSRARLDLTDPATYARYAYNVRLHTLMLGFQAQGCPQDLAWVRAEDMLHRARVR
jgi:hypothetical protein